MVILFLSLATRGYKIQVIGELPRTAPCHYSSVAEGRRGGGDIARAKLWRRWRAAGGGGWLWGLGRRVAWSLIEEKATDWPLAAILVARDGHSYIMGADNIQQVPVPPEGLGPDPQRALRHVPSPTPPPWPLWIRGNRCHGIGPILCPFITNTTRFSARLPAAVPPRSCRFVAYTCHTYRVILAIHTHTHTHIHTHTRAHTHAYTHTHTLTYRCPLPISPT